MLSEKRVSGGTLEQKLDNALSADYWAGLIPDFSIEGDTSSATLEANPIEEPEHEALVDYVNTRGYFRTPATLSPDAIGALAGAADKLRAGGWPPAFCFVYDEAWRVARTPSLSRIVESVLGSGYRQIPNVWCHYVLAAWRSKGWPPHIDGYGGETSKNRLTVWIPLTEATLDNGCMYVIPKDAPHTTLDDEFDKATARRLLQGARALPAKPGEALGWLFETIHWGSSSTPNAKEPRVSLSFEFIGRDATPDADELPLLETGPALPSFHERLRFIADGISAYARFEPSLLPLADLGKGLLERSTAGG
jgi:Phytanoyl-CoA dioxygenase (PhyH)